MVEYMHDIMDRVTNISWRTTSGATRGGFEYEELVRGQTPRVFRLWRVDLSIDVLARFCQDDMKAHSEAVSGKIERPDIILACAVGFEF